MKSFAIKMAQITDLIFLVFLSMSMHNICLSTSISTRQNNYPVRSLACKTYNMTKMDCSYRNLLEVPILEEDSTIMLDLSHNQLENINNSRFKRLQGLLRLNVSYNVISEISATGFKGLQSLEHLNLFSNKLVDLPKNIFTGLLNLTHLDLSYNYFIAIPGEILAPLQSLQILNFFNSEKICQISLDGFQNLTNLKELRLQLFIDEDVSSDTFRPLNQLPLHYFGILLNWKDITHPIEKGVFPPLNMVTKMKTTFEARHALTSLNSPLKRLTFTNGLGGYEVIDKTSLQVLQKWNTSLETLRITLRTLRLIKDYAFIWIPNLLELNFGYNEIDHLATNAFYGLNALRRLILSSNSLTEIPSNALEVFRNSASLQHLDLLSNRIAGSFAETAFSAVSSSLSSVSIGMSHTQIFRTKWLSMLRNLKQCTLILSESSFSNVYINSSQSLPSLKTFTISNFYNLFFPTRICSVFPNVEVAALRTSLNIITKDIVLDLLEPFNGCFHLKELDLSGILSGISALDLKHFNITLSTLETLKLAHNTFLSITLIFFINAPKLEHLDMAGNLLESINSEIAHMYPGLVNLDLRDNELESLSGLAELFFLQNLNASGNKITVVPAWLLSNARNLVSLDLRNNPFQCTCEIKTFRNWILSDKQTWLQPGKYVCATPANLKGMGVTSIKLDCTPKTAFYVSITIPLVLLFCVGIIFLIRYRWHIKYKIFLIYRNYRPFPDDNEDFEMLQLQYHAYVAYNENSAVDESWVVDELQPNMEEGPDPMRLCIKSRDFVPGHFLLDSIDKSINESRKTILVLSPFFVKSEWCYYEMRMAQMRLINDNLDVLVLVLLNEIPENKMTLSLRQILCRQDYFKWPKDRAGQKLFWQSLKEELKGPVQVDRFFHE